MASGTLSPADQPVPAAEQAGIPKQEFGNGSENILEPVSAGGKLVVFLFILGFVVLGSTILGELVVKLFR